MDEFTNEFDLARNFGFDITMPEGSMGLPGAFHQEYLDKCQCLYREFVSNMTSHIKHEKETKDFLTKLHKEKIDNLRFSLYRSENAPNNGNDPFSRRQDVLSVSLIGLESRGNTPWGLDTIPDEDEEINKCRPHTAPTSVKRSHSDVPILRPKTAGVYPSSKHDDDNDSDAGLSDSSFISKTTVLGVMDPKLERGSSRKITIGHHSFSKLEHGNVKAKLKHKEGQYMMKPIKVDFSQDDTAIVAYDPSKARKPIDPLNEKLAIVKRITTFKSPTIASDMKINNRVPIQKNLKGINAKRTTVADIYQNARDRRARHFCIVSTRSPLPTTDLVSETNGLPIGENKSNRLSVDINPYLKRDITSRSDWYPGEGRSGSIMSNLPITPIAGNRQLMTPSPLNESDFSESGNQTKLKSILHTGVSRASITINALQRDPSEYQNDGLDVPRVDDNGQDILRRPGSRVAFVRSESQMSNVGPQRATPDLNKSISSTFGVNFGKSRNIPSRTKDVNDQSDNISLASAVSVTSFMNKMKNAVQKTKTANGELERPESKLSFTAPARVESKVDTIKIVKQQLQKDKQLDERMAVWRRRMVAKASAGSVSARSRKGNGRLRLI